MLGINLLFRNYFKKSTNNKLYLFLIFDYNTDQDKSLETTNILKKQSYNFFKSLNFELNSLDNQWQYCRR